MDIEKGAIPAAFPFSSKYLKVNDSNLHYIDEGQGDPIVLLHGIPTSSYLWRNIIPYLTPHARCIAPDLIGFGKSDKPEIEYRIFDHIDYIEQFLNKLDLHNITFMLHGWGSVIGFHYASRYPEKIKSLAFFESYLRPVHSFEMLSLPLQELCKILNTPDGGYNLITGGNFFVNTAFSTGVIRKVSEEVLAHYRAPFPTLKSRLPLWQYIQDLPLGNGPEDVVTLITDYSNWLQKTALPKLFLYGMPGFLTTMDTVLWAKTHLPKITLVDIGDAHHYTQEVNPDIFGDVLRDWILKLRTPEKV